MLYEKQLILISFFLSIWCKLSPLSQPKIKGCSNSRLPGWVFEANTNPVPASFPGIYIDRCMIILVANHGCWITITKKCANDAYKNMVWINSNCPSLFPLTYYFKTSWHFVKTEWAGNKVIIISSTLSLMRAKVWKTRPHVMYLLNYIV